MDVLSFIGIDYDPVDRMIVTRIRRHRRRFRSAAAAAHWVTERIAVGDEEPVPGACWQLSARSGSVFWSDTPIWSVRDGRDLIDILTEQFDMVISVAEMLEPVRKHATSPTTFRRKPTLSHLQE